MPPFREVVPRRGTNGSLMSTRRRRNGTAWTPPMRVHARITELPSSESHGRADEWTPTAEDAIARA